MLIDEVRKEAENLKKFATKQELDKISLWNLDVNDVTLCIYGQITGHCRSGRAKELLKQCALPYAFDPADYEEDIELLDENERKAHLFDCGIIYENNADSIYFSPIETYIYLRDSNTKGLIDYLQGRDETFGE